MRNLQKIVLLKRQTVISNRHALISKVEGIEDFAYTYRYNKIEFACGKIANLLKNNAIFLEPGLILLEEKHNAYLDYRLNHRKYIGKIDSNWKWEEESIKHMEEKMSKRKL